MPGRGPAWVSPRGSGTPSWPSWRMKSAPADSPRAAAVFTTCRHGAVRLAAGRRDLAALEQAASLPVQPDRSGGTSGARVVGVGPAGGVSVVGCGFGSVPHAGSSGSLIVEAATMAGFVPASSRRYWTPGALRSLWNSTDSRSWWMAAATCLPRNKLLFQASTWRLMRP